MNSVIERTTFETNANLFLGISYEAWLYKVQFACLELFNVVGGSTSNTRNSVSNAGNQIPNIRNSFSSARSSVSHTRNPVPNTRNSVTSVRNSVSNTSDLVIDTSNSVPAKGNTVSNFVPREASEPGATG